MEIGNTLFIFQVAWITGECYHLRSQLAGEGRTHSSVNNFPLFTGRLFPEFVYIYLYQSSGETSSKIGSKNLRGILILCSARRVGFHILVYIELNAYQYGHLTWDCLEDVCVSC